MVPKERLSDMVRRILRSMYAVGVDKWGPPPAVDMAKHNEVALDAARQGIVLLNNDGLLGTGRRDRCRGDRESEYDRRAGKPATRSRCRGATR
jgi:beta-glucosidase-like glycosyl hydrolase